MKRDEFYWDESLKRQFASLRIRYYKRDELNSETTSGQCRDTLLGDSCNSWALFAEYRQRIELVRRISSGRGETEMGDSQQRFRMVEPIDPATGQDR